MAAPYSQDLRDRVLAAHDRGMKTKQIADTFEVSCSWVRRVKQRRRETGETVPRRMGCPVVWKIDRARLAEVVQAQPDATLEEIRDRLGIVCSRSAICMALKELGLTFKKRRSTPQSRTARMWSSAVTNGGRSPARSMQDV